MEIPEFTYNGLDKYGYRELQKMAKSMGLPSNVKKIYLIEMMLAKRYNSPEELEVIINRVKLDRLKVSQSRWSKRKIKRAQASEVSSTSKNSPKSPSITVTPKHSSYIIRYSPDTTQTIIKYPPIKSYPVKRPKTDRILRSYNNKAPRPDYAMMDDLAIYGNSSFDTKNSSVNTKLARASSSKTHTNIACDYAIMNHGPESSFNTKNSSFNRKLARADTNTASYNTKIACDYSIMNHGSESSFNTKIVKRIMDRRGSILDQSGSLLSHSSSVEQIINRRTPIMDQSNSIMDQSTSIANYNSKFMNPEIKRPNNAIIKTSYGIMDRNGLISKVVRGQNSVGVKTAVPRVEVRRQSLLNSSVCLYNEEIQIGPVRQSNNTSSPIPSKRQRTISGIYPITTQENTYYECVQTVDYRHTDGKITKINALIQKPRNTYPIITVQDVINHKIESQIFKTSNNESTELTKAIERRPIITTTENGSGISKENIQPTNQYLDFSNKFTEKTQAAKEYFDFSINSIETRDFSANCTEKTWSTNKEVDFSIDCANNIQPDGQILDFSKSCINHTQTTRQCNDLSMQCIQNTQPVRQFLESSSTPTYTNVVIKEMADNGNISVYYHKKIRSEQIRQRFNDQNEVLPHINEVFSQFNEAQYRNLTQPLYVQVSQESDRFPYCPILQTNQESASMLESLYNFRQQLIVNEPLLKLPTTTNTKCVFTANTVVTAEEHHTPMYRHDPSYAPVNLYNTGVEAETRLYDYMRGRYHRDFTCNEVLSPSNSSISTKISKDLGANVTIPEMVEDAMELISQDGDYLERIDMDSRVQCIICQCEWAGSHLVLEYHIRQVHQNDILYKDSPEWSIVLTLGALASHEIWFSHVVHFNEYLYIVSAKYYKDCIMAALTTLTETHQNPKRGKITIYNKISGRPFVWENEIPYIPESMPYQCTENCLKIDITDLDLLPNSANLKFVNNELKSLGNKVVIGQPSLNDINIVLFVQILE